VISNKTTAPISVKVFVSGTSSSTGSSETVLTCATFPFVYPSRAFCVDVISVSGSVNTAATMSDDNSGAMLMLSSESPVSHNSTANCPTRCDKPFICWFDTDLTQ